VRAPDDFRLRIAALPIALLVAAGLPIGCHKAADKAKVEELKQSLDTLQKRTGDLRTKFMDLRKRFDAVPPDLPGFQEMRGKFYAIEEGRGITDTRVMLLSSRLEAAAGARNREELEQIAKEIAQTYGEVGQIDELYVKLLHQAMSFQRQAARDKAEKQAAEKQARADATDTPPTATAKTKRSKPKP